MFCKTVTKIVLVRFTITGEFKAMFWTPAIAYGPHDTAKTILADISQFTLTKFYILWLINQCQHIVTVDISKFMFRIYKVIAGVDIPIGFNNQVGATGFVNNTSATTMAHLG
ncbi:hypothetical protein D3C79_763620 [compost metagenome]